MDFYIKRLRSNAKKIKAPTEIQAFVINSLRQLKLGYFSLAYVATNPGPRSLVLVGSFKPECFEEYRKRKLYLHNPAIRILTDERQQGGQVFVITEPSFIRSASAREQECIRFYMDWGNRQLAIYPLSRELPLGLLVTPLKAMKEGQFSAYMQRMTPYIHAITDAVIGLLLKFYYQSHFAIPGNLELLEHFIQQGVSAENMLKIFGLEIVEDMSISEENLVNGRFKTLHRTVA